jgi:hypothetical protein
MRDPVSKLRLATRRAKSDVANKLVSMCLHEMSRKIARSWPIKIDDAEYGNLVREWFGDLCPYCRRALTDADSVIEHLDGMNRLRAGLHVPGNVLVACKTCNNEKRRDDSLATLTLAKSGWESFLSHDGTRCSAICGTCKYWQTVWPDAAERRLQLSECLERLRSFRNSFPEFKSALLSLKESQPSLLAKLYTDCQSFAEREINAVLENFDS